MPLLLSPDGVLHSVPADGSDQRFGSGIHAKASRERPEPDSTTPKEGSRSQLSIAININTNIVIADQCSGAWSVGQGDSGATRKRDELRWLVQSSPGFLGAA